MAVLLALALAPALAAGAEAPSSGTAAASYATAAAGRGSADLVDVASLIPDAIVDLRYATDANFMKRAVYPKSARCLLRPGTAKRLVKAADALRAQGGIRLVLYDCYRPLSVQKTMWEIFPVRGYVAPPSGGSIHNRGAAIDLGLASADGAILPMPSAYDEFSERAWHAYDGGTAEELRNRSRLKSAMVAAGFSTIRMEWWHYEDPGERKAPLLDRPFALDPP
ncbi:D-alanyl-D-alanine dipeptidase [Vulgatibacter incomptus]|uniref:D-alanyl-D-alanine dipeptidase n=1 Tax=Vulgatibacter incomptus TaxID=1391653 RepID=A0A0K1PDI2_9BACT|nr:D-alanyl-D-alanine dipeptidase [Vulgatibacter incomptus]